MSALTDLPPRHPRVLDPARLTWDAGVPGSLDYGDHYFSPRDGVGESRAIFLQGNDLPRRWQHRSAGNGSFRIAELGFGTGMNFAVARAAFLDTAPAGHCLDYIGFELHPLAAADRTRLAKTLAGPHPELARGLEQLNKPEPPRLGGWQRSCLDRGRVRLSLFYGDASAGLADWLASARAGRSDGADAWFLDGFAPRCNPDLWSPALCALLAALSRPDATLATSSDAGSVRASLLDAGFDIEPIAGSPGKRQALGGRLRATGAARASAPARPRTAHVIGAGLAGATCAAALATRGLDVQLHDAHGIATGASRNPWAVLHPRLPLDDGPRGPFFALAYAFARHWLGRLDAPSGWQPRRVLQLPEIRRPDRLLRVLARFGASGDWLHAEELAGLTGIAFPGGGHADLPRLIASVLRSAGIAPAEALHTREIRALHHGPDGWRLAHAGGHSAAADVVVIAAGADSAALLPGTPPLGRMRGQIDRTFAPLPTNAVELPILTGRGHALVLADGWVCGASYERDGDGSSPTRRERDANLARLAHLHALLSIDAHADGSGQAGTMPIGEAREAFVGVRCTVPDRAPLIGAAPGAPGLWVSAGHASAGLLTCPLAAEAIAAAVCREPPVLDQQMWRLLAPGRFSAG